MSRRPSPSSEPAEPAASAAAGGSTTALTPARWRQVCALFDRLAQQPAGEREAFLTAACGDDRELRQEVVSLLAAHVEADDFFIDHPAIRLQARAVSDAAAQAADDDMPSQAGNYRLERSLGRGGMGAVYLATRADDVYRKRVAVKLLKRGMDTDELVRRFRGERQILANLDHPNITKLLDGGSTEDGRPFLVMEHVEGEPIDRYCDRHRLPTPDRLRLFRKVCAAVHFAHQNLVVHRDLKPSNILIGDDGEPKLLDFGIAKLLAPEGFPVTVAATVTGGMLMTPAYASPEQVRGAAITTASDVYSLGVVLYQLLTGHRPYRLRNHEAAQIERVVCERQPEKPSAMVLRTERGGSADTTSVAITPETVARARREDLRTLRRRLAGDLDNVVLKALGKEPQRRYASAEQLAQDLDNVLARRPVTARPDTLAYRARLFVRRHRYSVSAAGVALALLIAFVVTLLVQREQILRQRNRAEAVSELMVEIFEIPDPTRAQGETVTARAVLDQGAQDIARRLRDQPAVRADLLTTIGRSYRNLGLYPEAASHLEEALALRRQSAGERHPAVAESQRALADVRVLEGRYAAGEALYREALALERQGDVEARVRSLCGLARARELQGDLADAEATFRRALGIARALGEPLVLGETLERFGVLLTERGAYDQAEACFAEALPLLESIHGDRHPDLARLINNFALLRLEVGDYDDAEHLYRRAESIQRRVLGAGHPQLATTLNNLGMLFFERGRYEQAEAALDEALAIQRAAYPDHHPNLATTLNLLGDLRFDQGRFADAEKLYRDVLARRRAQLGDDHASVATTLNALARTHYARGDRDAAQPLFEEALAISRRQHGDHHHQVATILSNLGLIARDRGDLDGAEARYREALASIRGGPRPDHPDVIFPLHNLASLQQRRGDLEAADQSFGEALRIARRLHGEDHPQSAQIGTSLAALKQRRGDCAGAEPLARSALAHFEAAAEDGMWASSARYTLGVCLYERKRLAAAAPFLEAAFEQLEQRPGLGHEVTRGVLERLIAIDRALGRGARATERQALLDAAGGG